MIDDPCRHGMTSGDTCSLTMYDKPCICDLEGRLAAFQWQPIETAPEAVDLLVWYDHDADPYQDPGNPDLLTEYATWAEVVPFMDGRGVTIAHKWPQDWQAEDEYGSGYWMPSAWFVRDPARDYEAVCNPTHWMPLPAPPEAK